MIARRSQPRYSEIVAFRTAAGKHDLGAAAAQQYSHRFAGALDGSPRLLPMMVDGGRVAKVLAKVRPHGLQHLGEHRSSRVVVEIDPSHHAASIVPMRGARIRLHNHALAGKCMRRKIISFPFAARGRVPPAAEFHNYAEKS
jgi:hypothetical protein